MSKLIHSVTNCPTCQSEVRVEGNGTTHSYSPITGIQKVTISALELRVKHLERKLAQYEKPSIEVSTKRSDSVESGRVVTKVQEPVSVRYLQKL